MKMLFPAKVKVSLVALVVAGGAAAAAALSPAGAAVGQSSQPIQTQIAVKSPATLVANGAGVDVAVKASCSGPLVVSGGVSVDITERVGKDLATGFGSTQFDCHGGAVQNIEVLAIANFPGKAFDTGSAVAQATVGACEVNGPCASQGVQPTIKIKMK